MRNLRPLFAALLLAAAAAPCAAQAAAATVVLSAGDTRAERGGATLPLQQGSTLEPGDVVVTGSNAYLNLLFADDARMLLRPDTRFHIERFELPPPPPRAALAESPAAVTSDGGALFLRLFRGGFRTVTGLIGRGRRDLYQIAAPAITIGIRGTDYEALYCESDCPSAGGPHGGGAGLIIGVNEGTVELTRPFAGGATQLVQAGQYVMATDSGEILRLDYQPLQFSLVPLKEPARCQ